MSVFFWYPIKSDLSSVRYCTSVHWTNQFFKGTRITRPCLTGDPVGGGGGVHLRPLLRQRRQAGRKVQGDKLNIAVFFWYLGKSDTRISSGLHWKSHFI